MTKRNTVNKEDLTNEKILLTYKKGLLPHKQDLLTYTTMDLLTNAKKTTANFHGELLQQVLAVNSHGKFLRQVPAANSHDKFQGQIATANSSRKFSRQILEYVIQKLLWSNPLCGRASHVKM